MQTAFFDLDLIPLNAREQLVHERALSCARNYRMAEIDLLEAIDDVVRLRLFEKFRLTSCFQYCVQYLGLPEHAAAYFPKVARVSLQFPEMRDAVASGALHVSKAAKVCSVVNEENHKDWIAKAIELPKDKLEKAVAEASPGKAKRASKKPVGKNITRVSFDASDEFMKLLARAQDLESKRTSKNASIEDALLEALKDLIAKRDPVAKAERAAKRSSWDESKKVARAIPAKTKHEVNLRDRGACRVKLPDGDVCLSTKWTDIHHVKPKASGGTDKLENLITICKSHHHQWHEHDDLNLC